MVEHSPLHPKVVGLSPAVGRENGEYYGASEQQSVTRLLCLINKFGHTLLCLFKSDLNIQKSKGGFRIPISITELRLG